MDEALATAGEVVRADITRPEGFLLLGEVHVARLEFADAARAFERAVRKCVECGAAVELHATALSARVKAQMLTGAWDAAASGLAELHRLAPEDQSLPLLMAEVELFAGRPERALSMLHADADVASEALLRAVCCWLMDDQAAAVISLRRAMLLDQNLHAALTECDDASEQMSGDCVDLLERLDPLLQDLPEISDGMVAVAAHPAVSAEVAAIHAGLTPVQRADLLCPQRLAATTALLEFTPGPGAA